MDRCPTVMGALPWEKKIHDSELEIELPESATWAVMCFHLQSENAPAAFKKNSG